MHSKIVIYFSGKILTGVRSLRWNLLPRPRSYGKSLRLLNRSEKPTIQSHVSSADMKNDQRTEISVRSKNSRLEMAPGGGPPGLQKRIKKA
jgi:hypothetical protein